MPGTIIGLLEDCEGYEGKSGFGCNITMSQKVGKKTKRVTFRTKDKNIFNRLEALIDEQVVVVVSIEQNNFGTNLRDVLEVFDDVSSYLSSVAQRLAEDVA
jgi:hypothetical protein